MSTAVQTQWRLGRHLLLLAAQQPGGCIDLCGTRRIRTAVSTRYGNRANPCTLSHVRNARRYVGQYVVAQLIPSENRTYYTEVQGTSGSSCLTFYYYITRANAAQIGVWISDISGGTSQKLGTIVDVPYNGWHRTHFSFQPNVNSYHVSLSCYEVFRNCCASIVVF